MGSRALFLLRGVTAPPSSAAHNRHLLPQFSKLTTSSAAHNRHLLPQFSKLTTSQALLHKGKKWVNRSYSVKSSNLESPDLTRLAQTARISLTPTEVEEFAPKIQQVVDWFGQLQSVDLESIDPAIRAGTDVGSFRDDVPNTFENREAMIAAVPSYDEPYIKVPKVLKEE